MIQACLTLVKRAIRRARPGGRALARSDRGAVAMEFVIIMPIMLLVLLGFSEVYMYMRAVSIVEHTAFTLADSIGQMPEVINDPSTSSKYNLGAIWSAATVLATPNQLQAQGGVIVTSICDKGTQCGASLPAPESMASGTPEENWQQSAPFNDNTLMKTKETAASLLPSTWPFRTGDSAVVVEVFYKYTPFTMSAVFWTQAPGTQLIYERVYVRPRSGLALPLVASSS
jgi:TadE-like protein